MSFIFLRHTEYKSDSLWRMGQDHDKKNTIFAVVDTLLHPPNLFHITL